MIKKCPKCKSNMEYEETEYLPLSSCAASGDCGETSSNCIDNAYRGGTNKYWICSSKKCGIVLPVDD